MSIIKSILDTDLYKLSMSYAYSMLFPDAEGEFNFIDRNKQVFTEDFVEELKREFYSTKSLSLTKEEFNWCVKNIPYIGEFYWEWLKGWTFDPEKIKVWLDEEKHLHITVTDKMYRATLYEVMILAIVSELMHKHKKENPRLDEVISKLDSKIGLSNRERLFVSDMGTRRRFSYMVHDEVIKRLKENSMYFNGTSNVHLAMKYSLKPIGTCAHEYFSLHGSFYGYKEANHVALDNWNKVYHGYLGIALTDTFTSKVFFDNFSKDQAIMFDGLRCDSGDEYKYVNMATARYKELGINPLHKTIIFSNSLDFEKALEIQQYCSNRIGCAFGIGTNLVCDIPGVKPANIVMKLSKCRINSKREWSNCIKISDDLGKHTGNEKELQLAKDTLCLEI
mgnify:FL=1